MAFVENWHLFGWFCYITNMLDLFNISKVLFLISLLLCFLVRNDLINWKHSNRESVFQRYSLFWHIFFRENLGRPYFLGDIGKSSFFRRYWQVFFLGDMASLLFGRYWQVFFLGDMASLLFGRYWQVFFLGDIDKSSFLGDIDKPSFLGDIGMSSFLEIYWKAFFFLKILTTWETFFYKRYWQSFFFRDIGNPSFFMDILESLLLFEDIDNLRSILF